VSPPLFLVADLPAGGQLRLDGPEGHHAATVQRLRVGEVLTLADGRGATATARVSAVGRGELELTVHERWYVEAPDPRVTVVQGIAKGERGELAVELMTEVGVDEIVPWQAARCVARWRDDKPLRRWRVAAREATKQSRRAWLPEVTAPVSTADVLARMPGALVLHEEARASLSTIDLPDGAIVLVVGPEGGIAADELDTLTAAGAVPVRLGRPVLRTSTAGAAAIAALSVRLGRW
jgi:16S rRNA (uracil1498-N3)-methyltransferase